MKLTQDEMALLRARFESLGAAAVRRDLDEPARKILMGPVISGFARAWLAEKEQGELS